MNPPIISHDQGVAVIQHILDEDARQQQLSGLDERIASVGPRAIEERAHSSNFNLPLVIASAALVGLLVALAAAVVIIGTTILIASLAPAIPAWMISAGLASVIIGGGVSYMMSKNSGTRLA